MGSDQEGQTVLWEGWRSSQRWLTLISEKEVEEGKETGPGV
jgi:hypothetical protein